MKPDPDAAHRLKLKAYIGLLREAHAHYMGAQSIYPSDDLGALISAVNRLQSQAEQDLHGLGLPPAEPSECKLLETPGD